MYIETLYWITKWPYLKMLYNLKRLFHYFWFPSVLSLPFHNSCFGSFSFSAQTGFFGKWLLVLWGSILTQKGGNFMFRIWDHYLMKGYLKQTFDCVYEYRRYPQSSVLIFKTWLSWWEHKVKLILCLVIICLRTI